MLRAFSYVRTAAHSLHIVSKTLDMSQDFEKEDLSSTTLQNIRLQLDCVVPSLCDVIESVPHLSVENVDTIDAAVETLISIASTEKWYFCYIPVSLNFLSIHKA